MRTPLPLVALLSILSASAHASGENWHAAASFEAAKTAASADKAWFFSKPVISPERRAEIKAIDVADLKAKAKTMLDSLPSQFPMSDYDAVASFTGRVWDMTLDAQRIREGSAQRCYALVTKDSSQPFDRMLERVKACTALYDLRMIGIYGNIVPRIIEETKWEHPTGRRGSELATGWAIAVTEDEGEILIREQADATGLSDRELEMNVKLSN